MKDVNTPIVQEKASFETLMAAAKVVHKAFMQLERQTVEKAMILGEALIAAKEKCPHGSWLASLSANHIHRRTAARCMKAKRDAKQMGQAVPFGPEDSASDPLEHIYGEGLEEETEKSESLNQSSIFPEDEQSYANKDIIPDPRCERCQRVGLQSCDKCVREVEAAIKKGWKLSVGGTDRQTEPAAGSNGSGTKPEPTRTETASKPPEPPKPPYPRPLPGGYSGHVVNACVDGLRRHAGNLYLDAGLADVDGLPVVDEWLESFLTDLESYRGRLKKRRKELKAKKG